MEREDLRAQGLPQADSRSRERWFDESWGAALNFGFVPHNEICLLPVKAFSHLAAGEVEGAAQKDSTSQVPRNYSEGARLLLNHGIAGFR